MFGKMENNRSNAPNIFHFEKRFHELLGEIQRYTDELDKLERERLSMHEELLSKESLLQNERRITQDLRGRLNLAMETIDRLEEERMRYKIDHSNLTINYDSVVKERDVLARETFSSQTEAVKIKIKMESLENKLRRVTRRKDELEKAMNELKNDNETIVANIDMNIAKLSKEQKYLLESANAVVELNKRLQTFCLCSHAINVKNKEEIKDLRNKLIALSTNESKSLDTNNKLHPEIEALCFKLKEMSMELERKMQNSTTLEENLNKIFQELSHKYNTNESNIVNQNNQ